MKRDRPSPPFSKCLIRHLCSFMLEGYPMRERLQSQRCAGNEPSVAVERGRDASQRLTISRSPRPPGEVSGPDRREKASDPMRWICPVSGSIPTSALGALRIYVNQSSSRHFDNFSPGTSGCRWSCQGIPSPTTIGPGEKSSRTIAGDAGGQPERAMLTVSLIQLDLV